MDADLQGVVFSSLSCQSLVDESKPCIIDAKDPSESGSNLSSPSESQFCSTQTDDDNDDYVAELTRQMANYMLQDDDKREKTWGDSGSPQSILWSPFRSVYGSPMGPSREPSPPLIEKMKIKEEINSVPEMSMETTKPEFQSKQALIDGQIRAVQANFNKMKQDKERGKGERRQQNGPVYPSRGRAPRYQQSTNNRHLRWGSGMKAVFLNGSGSQSGPAGTGVFLPRGADIMFESRKKTGCPTVLIPARVAHALKLQFEKVGVPSKFDSDFSTLHDALLAGATKNSSYSKQKGQQSKGVPAKNNQDMGLPQEWTY